MSDQDYILNLCDSILERRSLRQHRFPFLLGDRNTGLPVDAYYPDINLVIEFHERQHLESVPLFDRRMTISGVARGRQRAIYDERRRKVLPENGIDLVELVCTDFACDGRKRLKRIGADDVAVLRRKLQRYEQERTPDGGGNRMIIPSLEDLLSQAATNSLKEHVFANVEVKEDWQVDYGKRLSAAANRVSKDPQWIVVGISDKGVVVGRSEKWAKDTEETVSQQANSYLRPSQACQEIRCHQLAAGWIVSILVRNPGAVTKWRDKAHIAAGTTTKELSPEEMMELAVSLPGLADRSAQPATSKYSDDLIRDFCKVVAARQTEQQYKDLEKLSSIDLLGRLRIENRVAARVLFGEAKFRFISYETDGKPTENIELSGLYRILEDSFIKKIQDWSAKHSAHEQCQFPEEALREGLANAVAHAAYVEKDGDVIIELFPDRIAVGNLSQPEARYFANRWFSNSHHTLNRLLAEVLRISRHVDEVGWGKNAIFRESIKSGKRAPRVDIQKAGHLDRWILTIYSGPQDARHAKLLKRLQEKYPEERKALIAFALILWRDKPVKEIQNYIDGESAKQFAEVLSDGYGPIFYFQDDDRIYLRRWARILLGEGKDSKTHTPAEEADLFRLAYKIQVASHGGVITPKRLRDLGDLGETNSAKSLSSTLLAKWSAAGHVLKLKTGTYRFQAKAIDQVDLVEVLTRKRA